MKPPGSKIGIPDPKSTLSTMLQNNALLDVTPAPEPEFVLAIGSIMSAFADIGHGLTPFQHASDANIRTDNIAIQAFEFQHNTSQRTMDRAKNE